MTFSLTPGQWGDGPAGRELLRGLPKPEEQMSLIMDRAYQGNATRQLAFDLGFDPVVPPHPKRRHPWSIGEQLYRRRNEIERPYRRRNEIERLYRRLKAFRRIFSRYDELDVMFSAFIPFAPIAEALRPRHV